MLFKTPGDNAAVIKEKDIARLFQIRDMQDVTRQSGEVTFLSEKAG